MQVITADESGPAYPIESVGNALRLLLLLRKRKELRVTECAAELGSRGPPRTACS